MLNNVHTENIHIKIQAAEKLPALWNGLMHLQDAWDGSDIVRLSQYTYQLLTTLAEQAQAHFQFWVQPYQPQDGNDASSQRSKHKSHNLQYLSVIVYGPLRVARAVGEWLHAVGLFLQMPVECLADVKYKNPHCLSFEDDVASTTGELRLIGVVSGDSSTITDEENFAGLYTDEVYDQAPQPIKILSPLHQHQRAALSFLLAREKGWDLEGPKPGIWKRHLDSFGATKYRNTLSGRTQNQPPPDFCGGVLADEMGLGKTCTMLSLIATDWTDDAGVRMRLELSKDSYPGTLIVVPFALLQVWEKQVREHFQPGSIKWKIFHGSSRHTSTDDLATYDIVVTTYNTVTIEWRSYKSLRRPTSSSQLFSKPWHRVVLDEAHVVRNKGTMNSKAACALESKRRWCITGTPIQNRLSDVFGLLRFLSVEPYNHFKDFENDVLRPWRLQNDKAALMKLLYLMKAIAIRRPRTIISLPDKHEFTEVVQFSCRERAEYETAREGAIDVLNAAAATMMSQHKPTYINALSKINEMRYVCNHGVRPRRHQMAESMVHLKGDAHIKSLEEGFSDFMEINSLSCMQCGTDLQEENDDEQRMLGVPTCLPKHFSENALGQICRRCLHDSYEATTPSTPSFTSSDNESVSSPTISAIEHSSKIQALMERLRRIPPGEKGVVFSYWTSTLAAVAQGLSESTMSFVQYDGTLSRNQRNWALQEFANNPAVQVILVSITCGGQGLDLTVANHAFLLEPQWNPMLEEQAMSRVHRLGQNKPVRLLRFIVQGTWEEKIRILQERKRHLVDLIVDKRNLKDGDEGKKQLHFLRELIT